jgi:hypothetical protein
MCKLKINDLVYINHGMFNRFETFKIIEISKDCAIVRDIHSKQNLTITNISLLKKVKDVKSR